MLVQHANGRAGTYLPPQGNIDEHERLFDAFLREFNQELIGGTVDRTSITLLGDVLNDDPPPGRLVGINSTPRPKHFFWMACYLTRPPARLNEEELSGSPVYVRSAWELQGLLAAHQDRPKKQAMVVEAVGLAFDRGMLHGGFQACSAGALAAA